MIEKDSGRKQLFVLHSEFACNIILLSFLFLLINSINISLDLHLARQLFPVCSFTVDAPRDKSGNINIISAVFSFRNLSW